jgi:hypothetical protein
MAFLLIMIQSENYRIPMTITLQLPDACFHFTLLHGSVWKVRTQDPENFDEEVKSLGTAR